MIVLRGRGKNGRYSQKQYSVMGSADAIYYHGIVSDEVM